MINSQAFLVAGDTSAELRARADQLGDRLDRRDWSAATETSANDQLQRLAKESQASATGTLRIALVSNEAQSVSLRLRQLAAQARGADASQTICATAFVFPGVGEQYPGMLNGLATHPAVSSALKQCFHALSPALGQAVRHVLDAPRDVIGERDIMRSLGIGRQQTASDVDGPTSQLATFVVEIAMAALWEHVGIRPSIVLGYSLGEYTAACVAGVLRIEDALPLLEHRAGLIAERPAGRMLTVGGSVEQLLPLLERFPQVTVAAKIAPTVSVLTGTAEEVRALELALRATDLVCVPIAGAQGLHGPLMLPAASELQSHVRAIDMRSPRIPWLSNVTGTWIDTEAAPPCDYWSAHLCQTVRFTDCLDALLDGDIVRTIEVGPGQTLSSFVRQHPRCGRTKMRYVFHSLPGRTERLTARDTFLDTLTRLWVQGVEVDWTRAP